LQNLVVVAHPDDETIWMGGLILRNPQIDWQICTLCRADDPDRAPRFFRAMEALGACGRMSDLDDSPVLAPLSPELYEIKERIADLAGLEFDYVFTHGAHGEYTHHPRHAQIHRAIIEMMKTGELCGELACFAYEDGGGDYTPRPSVDARTLVCLTDEEMEKKRHIIRDIYGFAEGSWEFEAAGRMEALDSSLAFL
jgi:LmbE family N-acetylglucosaminyl deacetylase